VNAAGATRRALDLFYNGCGLLAGLSLIAMAAFVMLQIVARPIGLVLTWTPEYAGYAMAALSFLGLAYTFNTGGQIRVGMLLNLLPSSGKRWLDGLCLAMGLGVMAYFAWHSAVMTWQSHEFNDMGQGVVPVPLWIPQAIMTFGLVAQVVAIADNLACLIVHGSMLFKDDEAAAVG
jgi:TRAP-type C4-dicarboxylate transport system permease small subunit